jgi:hypothetical protein
VPTRHPLLLVNQSSVTSQLTMRPSVADKFAFRR